MKTVSFRNIQINYSSCITTIIKRRSTFKINYVKQLLILWAIIILIFSCKTSSERDLSLGKTVDTNYQSVVAILRVDSTGKTIISGSGVLIHPNVILTAGHNNFSNAKTYWDKHCSTTGYIAFGNNALQSSELISFNWLSDIITHPDQTELIKFDSDTSQEKGIPEFTDIGLIFIDHAVLNKPIITLPTNDALSRISKMDRLVGVGYGYHKMDTVYERIPGLVDGLRRRWKLHEITLLNDLWLSTNCDSLTNLPFIGMFDSGAPLLLNDSIVVGIWGRGDKAPDPCLYSSVAARIDNNRIKNWILESIRTRLNSEIK